MKHEVIVINNKKYVINLAYDHVINVFSVFKNKVISDKDKLSIACALLVKNRVKPQHMESLIKEIFEQYINSKKGSSNQKPLFDFVKDKDFIFSSFLQAYNINLNDEKGKLSWSDFIALFEGLPDSTKIVEVMSIRGRPLPPPDKYNAEERANLIRLKNYYSLDENEQSFKEGLASLFNSLKQRAVSY